MPEAIRRMAPLLKARTARLTRLRGALTRILGDDEPTTLLNGFGQESVSHQTDWTERSLSERFVRDAAAGSFRKKGAERMC